MCYNTNWQIHSYVSPPFTPLFNATNENLSHTNLTSATAPVNRVPAYRDGTSLPPIIKYMKQNADEFREVVAMTRLHCMMDSLCGDVMDIDSVSFRMLCRFNNRPGKNNFYETHLAPWPTNVSVPTCKMLTVPLDTAGEIALGSSRSNTHDIFNHGTRLCPGQWYQLNRVKPTPVMLCHTSLHSCTQNCGLSCTRQQLSNILEMMTQRATKTAVWYGLVTPQSCQVNIHGPLNILLIITDLNSSSQAPNIHYRSKLWDHLQKLY